VPAGFDRAVGDLPEVVSSPARPLLRLPCGKIQRNTLCFEVATSRFADSALLPWCYSTRSSRRRAKGLSWRFEVATSRYTRGVLRSFVASRAPREDELNCKKTGRRVDGPRSSFMQVVIRGFRSVPQGCMASDVTREDRRHRCTPEAHRDSGSAATGLRRRTGLAGPGQGFEWIGRVARRFFEEIPHGTCEGEKGRNESDYEERGHGCSLCKRGFGHLYL
jgi:hypothetical protein